MNAKGVATFKKNRTTSLIREHLRSIAYRVHRDCNIEDVKELRASCDDFLFNAAAGRNGFDDEHLVYKCRTCGFSDRSPTRDASKRDRPVAAPSPLSEPAK